MIAYFDRFIIEMTKEQAHDVSHQGACDNDVKELIKVPKIARQLKKINPDLIRAELKEYGAWDEVELSDNDANFERIIWIAGGNIKEELYERKHNKN